MLPGRLAELIDDRSEQGVFQVSRAIFDDPAIFELEMQRIFEGGWVFLGIASQAAAAHDYFTTSIGRVPVIVSRDGEGRLHGLINSCPHKGSRVAQHPQGNARLHVCPYHSWSFDSAGRNKAIKWKKAGCYPGSFDATSHDLPPLPAFAEYRGFLFGSLVPNLCVADRTDSERRVVTSSPLTSKGKTRS